MKLITTMRVTVYGVVDKDFESKDGKDKLEYYQAHIRQGKDMATVSVTENAYIQLQNYIMKEVDLQCDYDTDRGKFRVLGIVANPFNNKAVASQKPETK